MTIMGLILSGDALAGMVIDGPATGVLQDVKLSGSDMGFGIVQQDFTSGMQPMITGATPPLQIVAGKMFPVAARPTMVPKNLSP